MKWNVGSSVWMQRQPASRSASSSLFIASAMSQITWRLSLYLGVWMSRKRAITCEQHVPNLTGLRVLELLAKADIEHAGVERATPHAHVEPARSGKRARDSARKNQIGGRGEHGFLQSALYFQQCSAWSESHAASRLHVYYEPYYAL